MITPTVTGTLGTNGWYRSSVTVSWSVVDAESAIGTTNGCDAVTITADQAQITYTCTATSAGGTTTKSVSIQRDATPPTLSPSVSPDPVLLHGTATASAGATDDLSGIASQDCGAVHTGSVGSQSVSCTATDHAGNTANATARYQLSYAFSGFGIPVSDAPGVLNVAKAGQTIPLKWRLLDGNGNPVLTLSGVTVTVTSLACAAGSSSDEVEEYGSGSSGLQNLGNGYYQYNWKTEKSYAGSCKTMQLNLSEGNVRTALFQFTK